MVQQRCARRKYLRAVYYTDVHTGLEKLGFKTEFTIMLEINRQTFVLERVYAKTLRTIGASSAPLFTR